MEMLQLWVCKGWYLQVLQQMRDGVEAAVGQHMVMVLGLVSYSCGQPSD